MSITSDSITPLAGQFEGFEVGEKGIVNKAFGLLRQMGLLVFVLFDIENGKKGKSG
jgi:hypothetical protein